MCLKGSVKKEACRWRPGNKNSRMLWLGEQKATDSTYLIWQERKEETATSYLIPTESNSSGLLTSQNTEGGAGKQGAGDAYEGWNTVVRVYKLHTRLEIYTNCTIKIKINNESGHCLAKQAKYLLWNKGDPLKAMTYSTGRHWRQLRYTNKPCCGSFLESYSVHYVAMVMTHDGSKMAGWAFQTVS